MQIYANSLANVSYLVFYVKFSYLRQTLTCVTTIDVLRLRRSLDDDNDETLSYLYILCLLAVTVSLSSYDVYSM